MKSIVACACAVMLIGGALEGQSQKKTVFEAGVGISMAVLYRDSVPKIGSLAFSTNSPAWLTGLAATPYAVIRGQTVGLRAELVLWRGTNSETMTGFLVGPLLRFGARNPVALELAAGPVTLPVSQIYYPDPEEDDIWWRNPMRSHHTGWAFRAGMVHERRLNARTALRLAASWAGTNVWAPIRAERLGPPGHASLDYDYSAVDVGVVWALNRRR